MEPTRLSSSPFSGRLYHSPRVHDSFPVRRKVASASLNHTNSYVSSRNTLHRRSKIHGEACRRYVDPTIHRSPQERNSLHNKCQTWGSKPDSLKMRLVGKPFVIFDIEFLAVEAFLSYPITGTWIRISRFKRRGRDLCKVSTLSIRVST